MLYVKTFSIVLLWETSLYFFCPTRNRRQHAPKGAYDAVFAIGRRRIIVSSEENFEGKLFVQFVALQLMSYIKRQMDVNGLFNDYTMQSLLDEIDVIEYYQQLGKVHHLSGITEKQFLLYELMYL